MTWHNIGMYFSTLPKEITEPYYALNQQYSDYYQSETKRLFGTAPDISLGQLYEAKLIVPVFVDNVVRSSEDWGSIAKWTDNPFVRLCALYRKYGAQCMEWANSDARCSALTEELSQGREAIEKLKFSNHDLCIPGTLVRMSDGKEYVIGGVVGTKDIDCDSIPHDGLVLECKVLL